MDDLSDPRQARRQIEMAADHGQAGRPAVGLVDLIDVREDLQPLSLFDEAAIAAGKRARPSASLLALIHLARADLLFHGGIRRQHLFPEVGRHGGASPIIVLRDPRGDLFLEIGVVFDQALKGLRRQLQQPACGHGFDTGRARRVPEERNLAEEIALAQVTTVIPLPVLLEKGAQPTFLDEIHRPRRIALPDDHLTGRDDDRFQFLP